MYTPCTPCTLYTLHSLHTTLSSAFSRNKKSDYRAKWVERSLTFWNKRAIPSIWTSDFLFLRVGKLNTGHNLNLNSFWLCFYKNKRERIAPVALLKRAKRAIRSFKKRANERFPLVCQKNERFAGKTKEWIPHPGIF